MKTFRKYIILCTILLSLALTACNNLIAPTDQDDIIPKVKSISKYLVDSKTMEKSKLLYIENYNSLGQIEKFMQFDDNQKLILVNNFTYTKISSFETSVNITADGDTINKVTTETIYNSIGNIEFKNVFDSDGDTLKKIIFTYDGYNNVNQKETIDLTTGKTEIISYKLTYNDDGQVIKRESYSNGQLTNKQDYSYTTSKGIGVIIKTLDSSFEQTVQYNFNDFGKIISEYHLDGSGNIIAVYKYFYTYYNL